MSGMVYSPEPKVLAHPDETGISARPFPAAHTRVSLERVQKANTLSMSRWSPLPLRRARLTSSGTRPAFLAAAVCLAAAPLLPAAHAQSAATFNKRAQAAEVREDYDTSYEAYRAAHLKKPKDLRYLAHLERMRFLAATQHIDRGRVLRQSGDFPGAMREFLRAAEIDKSNQAAQQEIERTQRDQPPPGLSGPAAAAAAEQMSQQNQVLREVSSLAGPITLRPASNELITLHTVEEVKNIYIAIGKLAGLNVLFDPELPPKRIPIDLTSVSLSEALRIVGTIAGTFYKPVTANTIFVAANNVTKHAEVDDLAVQTFYLSNSSQPNDGNEILTGLRLLLDASVKLYLVPSQNAIVMRGTTDQLMLAQKLVYDFDRARPEVVIDVAVLEVNRDKIRNLGITLPTSVGLTPQIPTSSTTTTGTTTSATNATNLNLNNLAHFNSTDVAVSISGGTINALLSDTDTRVLQNPRIRATDGQRATLKIGQKIPIATGSYNAGVSTGVASIGVQTQFTYLDVGVSIDITPTVHYNRDVTLKTDIQVSQQNGSQTISGVTEPIIGQRTLQNVIQLRDGEPSILAGILTKQDNKSVAGTPGLGEIPFFKFFFSSQNKEVQQDEIVFLLIPHIVRESVLTRANMAAIDTGTSRGVELRHLDAAQLAPMLPPDTAALPPPPAPITAANAASAAIQQMHQQSMQPVPPPSTFNGAQPPSTPAVAGGAPVSFSVSPGSSIQTVGSTFQVAVMLDNGRDISAIPVQLHFDPRVLQLANVDAGEYLSRSGVAVTMAHRDEGNGLVTINAARPPDAKGVSGQGSVFTVTFKAVAAGDSTIALTKVGARDTTQAMLPAVSSQATVHVQ